MLSKTPTTINKTTKLRDELFLMPAILAQRKANEDFNNPTVL